MTPILNQLIFTFSRLDVWAILDILVVAAIIYGLLNFFRRTAASSITYGLLVMVLAIVLISNLPRLVMLNWLFRNTLPFLAIAILVLFQPELRQAMRRIGEVRGVFEMFNPAFSASGLWRSVIDELCIACERLAERRYGALIVLERSTGVQEYAETGTRLDALVSAELLQTIFMKGTALHDGAVIIRANRVIAAGVTLPLSRQPQLRELGMRHRAAVGLTEVTDAVTLIVSEETGAISLANKGYLVQKLDANKLRKALVLLYQPRMRGERRWYNIGWPWLRRQAIRGPEARTGA
ncbi:MAG: TIGR00159 family protein [Chloroflexi bacterium]|nr:TIGR00159 family protein [Chloroflexota bacterium]